MYVCGVCVCVCVTSAVFLSHSSSYFLRHGFSLYFKSVVLNFVDFYLNYTNLSMDSGLVTRNVMKIDFRVQKLLSQADLSVCH